MEQTHRDALRHNRSFLKNNIEGLAKIVDDLMAVDIITESMSQEIFAKTTNFGKILCFLDILPKRGPLAFKAFCDALHTYKQTHVIDRINPGYRAGGPSPTSAPPAPVPVAPAPVPAPTPQPVPYTQTTKPVPKSPKEVPSSPMAGTQEQSPSFGAYSIKSGEPIVYEPPSCEPLFSYHDDWPKESMIKDKMEIDVTNYKLQQKKNIYPFVDTKFRGRALIISNRTYSNKQLKERTKVDTDGYNINYALRELKFKCILKSDITEEGFRQELAKEAKKDPPDVFVLVILSYGGDGTVLFSDGKEMPMQEIVNLLSVTSCPSLKDIPKLVFLQACGTVLKDVSDSTDASGDATLTSLASIEKAMKNLHLGQAEGDQTDTRPGSTSDFLQLEDTLDILVAMATMPDSTSNEHMGSLFINGLAYALCHYAKSDHILEILNKVNRLKRKNNVGANAGDQSKTEKLCSIRHSLTRYLYLMPGYTPDTLPTDPADFVDVRKGKK